MRIYYKNYLVAVLMAILALNNADPCVIGLLLQDIKVDLSLSDTQLGFLTGIAFALFYAVMGIPIARWADRGNRVTVIAVITAVWGVMMALCGLTTSFVQLLLSRIGVAAVEAGTIFLLRRSTAFTPSQSWNRGTKRGVFSISTRSFTGAGSCWFIWWL